MAQIQKSRSQRRRDNITKSDENANKEINKVLIAVLIVMAVSFIFVLFMRTYTPPVKLEIPEEYNRKETQTVVVEFTVKDRGSFKIELYNDKMPKTVENFVSNIYTKAYINKKVHSEDDFKLLIGGSDEEYDNSSSTELKFEQHEEMNTVGKYTVGMIKHTETGNNSRLIFMISKANNDHMDGEYSMFGKVVEVSSENVVDSLKLDDVIEDTKIISIDGVEYTGGYAAK